MPDWSYQTIFRPLLFQLPPDVARRATLTAMSTLARMPLGPNLIELMGHMSPPEQLRTTVAGIPFPSPVGLDAGLDPEVLAVKPLSQFGFGYVEAGPVTHEPVAGPPVRRLDDREAIWYSNAPANPGLKAFRQSLERSPSRVPVGIRLAHAPSASPKEAAHERSLLILGLQHLAAFFTLETRGGADRTWDEQAWDAHLGDLMRVANRPVFIAMAPDFDHDRAFAMIKVALQHKVAGVIISGGVTTGSGWYEGLPSRPRALGLLRSLREWFGPELPIIAGGGIHSPADALMFRASGATMVQVHAGLVYTGPGLPKRINEAFAYAAQQEAEGGLTPEERAALASQRGRGWMGAALMATGIFVGGVLATWIALTRVVLPYDEAFVGLTREQLEEINPRLLDFMEHDRISLSGTMMASALLYFYLAYWPWREGEHWARPAYLFPATLGFLSYFLWPGYGYLEPLHTAFYLCLLPFFIWAFVSKQRGGQTAMPTSLQNDRIWRLGLVGQLLWIILAAGGTVAGLTIMTIGVTTTFVPEDLAFMQTTAEALRAVPRLVPLIAHDRFGFGTALTCNGITVLLMALWGFRRGARWLWLAMCVAGVPSYVAAFGTHISIGYTDLWHLTPPLVGLVFLAGALICSYPYLMAKE